MHFLILAALATVSSAMPSFIAVPADQIAFVDLSQLHVRRVPRQTLSPPPPPPAAPLPNLYNQDYQPIPLQQYQQQPIALAPPADQEPPRLVRLQQQPQPQDVTGAASLGADALAERPPDFGEYVDFGAHTGDQGAFGWYADFPVNNHGDSSYRK